MKKIILLLAILLAFGSAAFLFAQDSNKESSSKQESSSRKDSEYYYYNFTIEKVFTHRLGYVVLYRRASSNHLATTYIPHSWFSEPASKGELVWLARGKEWPTLTVFYKEGEFTHLRLYIHRWKGHQTWGAVPMNVDIDDRFNIETLEIVY